MTSSDLPAFIPEHGAITMLTNRGPIRLEPWMADRLLDLFEDAEGPAAAAWWNNLYDAVKSLTGIERVTSHRVAA